MDLRAETREFLTTRRARITPERANLAAYGGNRRVPGLRREEVAMLAGVSIDYYTRMERGNLTGVSEEVLESLAEALAARKVIERAKGLLMEKEGLSEKDAFDRLRRASQASQRPLKVIAEAVVATLGVDA